MAKRRLIFLVSLYFGLILPFFLAKGEEKKGPALLQGKLQGEKKSPPLWYQKKERQTSISYISLLVLGGLTACMGITFYILKKSSPRIYQEELYLVSELPLGPNEKVSLLQVRDQLLLLGVTKNQITLLKELEDHSYGKLSLENMSLLEEQEASS